MENKTIYYLKIMLALNAVFILLFIIPSNLWAAVIPAQGDFGYDLYDISVNKIIKGPIGFITGSAGIVIGAIFAMKNQLVAAAPAIIGGAAVIKAESITETMGMLI